MVDSYAIPLQIPPDQFLSWLSHWSGNLRLAITEGIKDVGFFAVGQNSETDPFGQLDLEALYGGRSFGERIEVRWRQRSGSLVSLTIIDGEDGAPPQVPEGFSGLSQPVPLEQLGVRSVMLWGDWQDTKEETTLPNDGLQFWYEQQIPHMFAYPWPDRRRRLSLKVAEYRVLAPASGASETEPVVLGDRIYRFVQLEPSPHDLLEVSPEEETAEGIEAEE